MKRMSMRMVEGDDQITISSALFQAAVWLENAYPAGSKERMIADICWQAHEIIEDYEVGTAALTALPGRSQPKRSGDRGRAAKGSRAPRPIAQRLP